MNTVAASQHVEDTTSEYGKIPMTLQASHTLFSCAPAAETERAVTRRRIVFHHSSLVLALVQKVVHGWMAV
jgi:hypothetical protein